MAKNPRTIEHQGERYFRDPTFRQKSAGMKAFTIVDHTGRFAMSGAAAVACYEAGLKFIPYQELADTVKNATVNAAHFPKDLLETLVERDDVIDSISQLAGSMNKEDNAVAKEFIANYGTIKTLEGTVDKSVAWLDLAMLKASEKAQEAFPDGLGPFQGVYDFFNNSMLKIAGRYKQAENMEVVRSEILEARVKLYQDLDHLEHQVKDSLHSGKATSIVESMKSYNEASNQLRKYHEFVDKTISRVDKADSQYVALKAENTEYRATISHIKQKAEGTDLGSVNFPMVSSVTGGVLAYMLLSYVANKTYKPLMRLMK